MREQFFLDARDYNKYSLLEDLASGPPRRSLTLIWMLTPDQGNGHGQRRPRFDPSRRRLNEFFTQSSRPRLGRVRLYFEAGGISCVSYGESAEFYLEAKDRDAYFRNIPSSATQLTALNECFPTSGSRLVPVQVPTYPRGEVPTGSCGSRRASCRWPTGRSSSAVSAVWMNTIGSPDPQSRTSSEAPGTVTDLDFMAHSRGEGLNSERI